jgi:hypothetical protein
MSRQSSSAVFYKFLAGSVLMLWGLPGSWGQQAGGLPAVSARVSALESALAAQNSALTTLQNGLTALQTSLSSVQNALTQETVQRAAVDSGLQAAVNQEAATRAAQAQQLQQQLQTLVAASSGPKVFQSYVANTFLVNGSGIVGALGPLPVGNYVVIGKAGVHNTQNTSQWLCTLIDDNGGTIDATDTHTDSQGIGEHIAESLSGFMVGAAISLSAPGSVRLSCFTGEAGSLLNNVRLIAVKVGEIN